MTVMQQERVEMAGIYLVIVVGCALFWGAVAYAVWAVLA